MRLNFKLIPITLVLLPLLVSGNTTALPTTDLSYMAGSTLSTWSAMRREPGILFENDNIIRLDPQFHFQYSPSAEKYHEAAQAQWSEQTHEFDLMQIVNAIAGSKQTEFVLVDISSGTGPVIEYVLKKLSANPDLLNGKKLRIVSADVGHNLSQSYLKFQMKNLYKSFIDLIADQTVCFEFYVLKEQTDKSFSLPHEIPDLINKADFVTFENAYHVVPPASRSPLLASLMRLLKPGGKLILGSGSILSEQKSQNSLTVDSIFSMIRQRLLTSTLAQGSEIPEELTQFDAIINEIREINSEEILENTKNILDGTTGVFQPLPELADIRNKLRQIEIDSRYVNVSTTEIRLTEEDFARFALFDKLLRSAVLPELASIKIDKANHGAFLDAAAKRAYEELFQEHPYLIKDDGGNAGHFNMWWTQLTITKPEPLTGENQQIAKNSSFHPLLQSA